LECRRALVVAASDRLPKAQANNMATITEFAFMAHCAPRVSRKAIRNSLDHFDLHDWMNFPRRRAPRMMKAVLELKPVSEEEMR
jgi:hypothetical protein